MLPPPPSISKYNASVPEWQWNRNKSVSISGDYHLSGEQFVNGLWLSYGTVYLDGDLHIGNGGINADGGSATIWGHERNVGSGAITSLGNTLYLYSKVGSWNSLTVRGHISDNSAGKVGLYVAKRNPYEIGVGIVRIGGIFNSRFTGDVTVDGRDSHLYLNKESGATAVKSNIYVRNGAAFGIERSNQIADSSTVTLSGDGSTFMLNDVSNALSEKFRALKVKGEGLVFFSRSWGDRYAKKLVVDDLIVGWGNNLSVEGWNADVDLFLVSKTSRNVRASLSRIKFTVPNQQIVELRSYNNYYWKLHASPEPHTYGAVLMSSLVFLFGRKRKMQHAR